ncbi:MAG: AmmeMemoRadiSam system radical SAM enzyme [Magnetococcus sp. DMHC-6]
MTMHVSYWQLCADGRMACTLCPRGCRLQDGQRGLCFVRARQKEHMVLTTFGRSSGFCIDPIEKKPINHFLPGTPTLSFGTAGCNLTCKFCQNWHMSKSKQMDALTAIATPEVLATAAIKLGCRSVSFTYNDPVIFLEYAVAVAQACRQQGIKNIAVTAGYINPEPRIEFFKAMDATNVDLKSFSEHFYRKLVGGRLQPVLETLEYIYHETEVWMEITTLLIPGENDSDAELHALTQWVVERLGVTVPLHFTAFHPDWRLQGRPRTPLSTLTRARQIALTNGLRYVYTGNVQDRTGSTTYCHHCQTPLIVRDGWTIINWHLTENGCCVHCATPCSGVFEASPGHWGAKRIPVRF